MQIKVTAKYPVYEVKRVVQEAYNFIFANGRKEYHPSENFVFWVKNCSHAFGGMYYGNKISCRIGKPNNFPRTVKYPNRINTPEYVMQDWKEALYCVAAHELYHFLQAKTHSGFSEIEVERRVVVGLEEFRAKRAFLELDFQKKTDTIKERVEKAQRRQAEKLTPEFEIQLIDKKLAKYQRRLKLYLTKIKKLSRRKKFLEKRFPVAEVLS